jgi:hypothetical protein
MTTQTILEYLEDERKKTANTQLRTEKEAARIEPLRHGHHRTAKQAKLELVPPVDTATEKRTRKRKTTVVAGMKLGALAGKKASKTRRRA